MTNYVQVHRFGDSVAVHVLGKTIYMKAKDARRMAQALNATARSIGKECFVKSSCGTFAEEFEDAR